MSTAKFVLFCVAVFGALSAVVCQKQYLPPAKGYDYEPPKVPFPSNPNPNKVPYPTQPPRPAVTRPPYNPPPPSNDHHHDDHHHHEPGMPFDFKYAVNEPQYGNDYSHNAVSDGDVTRGEYRVQLPDGRLQIVRYTADWKNGFNAEVSYEGEAKFPDQPQGQPSGPSGTYGAPGGGYKY